MNIYYPIVSERPNICGFYAPKRPRNKIDILDFGYSFRWNEYLKPKDMAYSKPKDIARPSDRYLLWNRVKKTLIFLLILTTSHTTAQSLWEPRMDAWRASLEDGSGNWQSIVDSCTTLLGKLPTREPLLRALAYSLKGSALRQGKQLDRALEAYQTALRLRLSALPKGHELVANAQQNLGNCLMDLDSLPIARKLFEQALVTKERLFPDQEHKKINLYNSLGLCCKALGDYPAATRHLVKALKAAQAESPPSPTRLVRQWSAMGSLMLAQNQPDAALTYYQNAHTLQRDAVGLQNPTAVDVLKNLAIAQTQTGRHTEATQTLSEALALLEKLPGAPPEQKGDCLLNLANCRLDMGDAAAAEPLLHEALRRYQFNSLAYGEALLSLGLSLRYRHLITEAVDTFLRAGALLSSGRSQNWQRGAAGGFQNAGSALAGLGRWEEALLYLEQARGLFARIPNSASDMAALLDKMAWCWLQAGNITDAGRALKEAQRIAPPQQKGLQFSIGYHLGTWHTEQQQWAQAAQALQQALAFIATNGPVAFRPFAYEHAQGMGALARATLRQAENEGNQRLFDLALARALDAMGTLQVLKGSAQAEATAVELQSVFDLPFNVAVEACLALGKPERAWHYSEAFKSNFGQQLALKAWQTLAQGLPNAALETERSIEARLRYFLRCRAVLSGGEAESNAAALDDSIVRLSDARHRLRLQMMAKHPEYARLWEEPPLPKPAQIQARLRTNQSLVAYHCGERYWFAFCINRDSFKVVKIPTSDTLETQVLRYAQYCRINPSKLPDTIGPTVFEDMAHTGAALYRQLVASLQLSAKMRDMLIVPDGLLCLLPFEALIAKPGRLAHRFGHRYWVQQVNIAYAHSALVWTALSDRPAVAGQRPLLRIAPDFQYNTRGLQPLRYNRVEVDTVGPVAGGDAWKGAQARRTRFLEVAGQYRVLLAATHGIADDREPMASFVAFTQQAREPADSALLFVSDIYHAQLNAELVVLSACQTAAGQLYRGEGILSVARAFQQAGAKTVVASLWNLDDRKAPALVHGFFKRLWVKMGKGEALSESKRAYLEAYKGLEAHPFFWSGLICMGDDSPLSEVPPPAQNTWLWYLGLGLLGLAGLIILLKIIRRGQFHAAAKA